MPNQQQIADHLGMSQQAVSKILSKMKIDWQHMSIDQIRVAYIKRLREVAAGNGDGSGPNKLMLARVTKETAEAKLAVLKLKKEEGELVDRSQLFPELQIIFASMKTKLLALPDQIKSELDAIHGINVDREWLQEIVENVLTDYVKYLQFYSEDLKRSELRADTSAKAVNDSMGGELSRNESQSDSAAR